MKLYHITKSFRGETFQREPRVPLRSRRAPKEDATIKRICVATTPDACSLLLPFAPNKAAEHAYLYEIDVPDDSPFLDKASPAIHVPDYDSEIAAEIWLTAPVTFNFLHRIRRVHMRYLGASKADLKSGKYRLTWEANYDSKTRLN